MPAKPARKVVTVAYAADHVQVTPRTIRQWIREGRLPAVRVGERCIRIDLADLEKLMQPCGPAAVSDPVERIARLLERVGKVIRRACVTNVTGVASVGLWRRTSVTLPT